MTSDDPDPHVDPDPEPSACALAEELAVLDDELQALQKRVEAELAKTGHEGNRSDPERPV